MRPPEHGSAPGRGAGGRNDQEGTGSVSTLPQTGDMPGEANAKVAQSAARSADELIPALARVLRTGDWCEFVHPMRGLKRYATFADYCDDFLRLPAVAVEGLLPYAADRKAVRLVSTALYGNPLGWMPTDDVDAACDEILRHFSAAEILHALAEFAGEPR